MPMPEASVYKDARPVLLQYKVRMSRQPLVIQSVSEPAFPKPSSHNQLRLRVFRPYCRHIIMTLLSSKSVHNRTFSEREFDNFIPNKDHDHSLYLRLSSEPNSMILRYKIAPPPTLHRLCTDFGTEEERRINGLTSEFKPIPYPIFS